MGAPTSVSPSWLRSIVRYCTNAGHPSCSRRSWPYPRPSAAIVCSRSHRIMCARCFFSVTSADVIVSRSAIAFRLPSKSEATERTYSLWRRIRASAVAMRRSISPKGSTSSGSTSRVTCFPLRSMARFHPQTMNVVGRARLPGGNSALLATQSNPRCQDLTVSSRKGGNRDGNHNKCRATDAFLCTFPYYVTAPRPAVHQPREHLVYSLILCALCRTAGAVLTSAIIETRGGVMAKSDVVALSGIIEPRGRVLAERDVTALNDLIARHEEGLLTAWMRNQLEAGSLRSGQIKEDELQNQSRQFLRDFTIALKSGEVDDITGAAWSQVRDLLGSISRSRALQGFTPSETATFIFSMKEPLFTLLRDELKGKPRQLADLTWSATKLLDKLGLYTAEVYAQSREDIVKRQAQELLELSTPVVELWEGIILLPLIGTLDSERTQQVMENLLNHIVKSGAEIAIIDITGVPTVDTLVAQHLIKTVSAARLMGADCIISGIRPQIAQTIVHLGLQLNVVSKATMADALALALKRTGQVVSGRTPAKPA